MPKNDTPSDAQPVEEPAVEQTPAPEPIDDGDAGGLAAWEAANYARAHQPSPIIEE